MAAVALLLLIGGLGLAAAGRFPFPGWLYHFGWYTVLVGLDAWLARQEGRAPWLGHPRLALSLWLWSVPVWLLFELLNLRVANWYYVFAALDLPLRRLSAVLAFATVLPAIYLGHRALAAHGWFADFRGSGFRVGRRLPGVLRGIGALFLLLALWRPTLFFPLIWGSTTLLVEPWNWRRRPEGSLLGDLSRGAWARPLRLLAAGLGIGLLWETFNAFATTRWIYTVPGLEATKLFEMPLAGYLGFPVFALDSFVLYQALVNLGVAVPGWDGGGARRAGRPRGRTQLPAVAAAAAAAAAFSLTVLGGVDRYSIDSWEPRVSRLPGAHGGAADRLAEKGYESLAALAEVDPVELATRTGLPLAETGRLTRSARLALLRGLGIENAEALAEAGIEDVCRLAAAPEAAVSAAVRAARDDPRAGRPARVRVWIRAAREACRDAEGG